MEPPRHLSEDDVSEEDVVRRPPDVVMWVRGGSAIECASIEAAGKMASKFAGRHPGVVVGVYQLVGFAITPERPAEFVPLDQKLLASPPQKTEG